MAKENIRFLVCCTNGTGSSLMLKMNMQKVLDRLGIRPGRVYHCSLEEGKTAAEDYDVILCAQSFTEEFAAAREKGSVLSVGTAWAAAGEVDIDGLMTEAEGRMYQDKSNYYRTMGIDRRKH